MNNEGHKGTEDEIGADIKNLNNETTAVKRKYDIRKLKGKNTVIDCINSEKTGIEKQLLDSNQEINDIIDYGTRLIWNVRVANDKREIDRRNYEALRRQELYSALQDESIKAIEKLDVITSRWSNIRDIKEPVGFFDELEHQKELIADLLKQKDDIIQKCQDEITRVDQKYYNDLEPQSFDISHLVEQINNQIKLTRKAYKEHIELLHKTIEDERKRIALQAATQWEEYYEIKLNDEQRKNQIRKERSSFYEKELQKIYLNHEELTRATKIRLEKDFETLQLEYRDVKNSILSNYEKLTYNYQILQKRDKENVLIKNQQNKRLRRLQTSVAHIKKKIQVSKTNADAQIKELSNKISSLQSSITLLEIKAASMTNLDTDKYFQVWEVNNDEAMQLLNRILDIDRLLHEQQLGIEWSRPLLPSTSMHKIISTESLNESAPDSSLIKKQQQEKRKINEEKISDPGLANQILKKIVNDAGFLVEEHVFQIMENFIEKDQQLIKVHNIFQALGITKTSDMNILFKLFLPCTWCPNCSGRDIKKGDNVNVEETTMDAEKKECKNHYLVVQCASVLSILEKYVEIVKKPKIIKVKEPEISQEQKKIMKNALDREYVKNYWQQFEQTFPESKVNVWKCLEHGLKHYLKILKDRETLDTECEFLRKQNKELQFLLQQFLPTNN